MRTRLVLVFLCVFFCSAWARAAGPRLMQTLGGEQPVRLQQVNVSAEISGGTALTRIDMVFFNPNARDLEGSLHFPLAAGQRVAGFALDIDGVLRDAVPVAKETGRKVFEAIERRQVDPALLEQTRGDNFQLRVYPIRGEGRRRVRLEIAESLPRRDGVWRYRLPLAFGDETPEFALRIAVRGMAGAPRVSGSLGLPAFRAVRGGHEAALAGRLRAGQDLGLELPAAAPQVFTQTFDGERFFLAEIPLAGAPVRRTVPNVVGLLWDSSGSGAGRALDDELAVLDRYFKAMRNGEVRLQRLRDRAEAVERFRVVDGRWDALRAALRATRYDGASALADWTPQPDVREYLLVSDGLDTYSRAPFPTLPAASRLYALNSARQADAARLRALAEGHGGRLIRIDAGRADAAAQALLSEPPRVVGLDAGGAADLVLEPDAGDGVTRVAGRLSGRPARLTLRLNRGGTIELPLPDDAPPHPLAARLWASYRIAALEGDFERHRAEIGRLGRRFGLATRETSLLVLDDIGDYVRYDIEPPPPLRAEFRRLKRLDADELDRRRGDQLERVVREFREKIDWWERRYPLPLPKQDAGTDRRRMLRRQSDGFAMNEPEAAMASAPMAALAAPAAAKAAPGEDAADDAAADGSISIALRPWQPDEPYVRRLRAAAPERVYAVYLDEKPSYADSAAFFLDVADVLLDKGQRALALRVLSNLAEMRLEDRHALRVLGHRLMQAKAPELAVPVFEEVLRLADDEPQSFRDLGLAYAAAGQPQRAIDTLYEVVIRPWDDRFAEIELVALAEINALVATSPARLDTRRIDARLQRNLPLDLRAVLSWDADNSDMDLWVTDPDGERCFYGNRFTRQGGRLSRDFTGGYGPEEFSLRRAKPGKYRVEANFYGSRQQVVAGATTVQLMLTTGFGRSGAHTEAVTLRLSGDGDTVFIGEFEVRGTPDGGADAPAADAGGGPWQGLARIDTSPPDTDGSGGAGKGSMSVLFGLASGLAMGGALGHRACAALGRHSQSAARAARLGALLAALPSLFLAWVAGGTLGGAWGAAALGRYGWESLGVPLGLALGLAGTLAAGVGLGAVLGVGLERLLPSSRTGPAARVEDGAGADGGRGDTESRP